MDGWQQAQSAQPQEQTLLTVPRSFSPVGNFPFAELWSLQQPDLCHPPVTFLKTEIKTGSVQNQCDSLPLQRVPPEDRRDNNAAE